MGYPHEVTKNRSQTQRATPGTFQANGSKMLKVWRMFGNLFRCFSAPLFGFLLNEFLVRFEDDSMIFLVAWNSPKCVNVRDAHTEPLFVKFRHLAFLFSFQQVRLIFHASFRFIFVSILEAILRRLIFAFGALGCQTVTNISSNIDANIGIEN